MIDFDKTYISVQGWMSTKLNLKGNQLLAFALVYGFSQDGQSEFRGTITYISKWLNCSRPTTISVMAALCNLHYINKRKGEIDGNERNFYCANQDEINRQLKNFTSKETLPLTSKETLPLTSKETLPYTIVSNIDSNIERENKFSKPPKKATVKRFTPPSLEEIQDAFKEKLRKKKILGADRIAEIEGEKFYNHYEANGWKVGKNKMKSWTASVAGWIGRMDQYKTTTNKIDPNEGIINTQDAHDIISDIAANGW